MSFMHPNPDISAKNTMIWKNHPEYKNQIEFIEEYLPEFLYKNLKEI